MKKPISFWTTFFSLCVLSVAVFAQGKADPNKPDPEKMKQYETRLRALSADDWDGKAKLAGWCQENGLNAQAKTILAGVLKAKPEHEEARKLAGYVKYQDKWILESDLEKIRMKEKEKDYKEKGYVQFKGNWVPASDVPFLEKGFVKVGDNWVTKDEKEKIEKGYMLVDGEWIAPAEAENVKKGLFKVDNKWVGIDEANQYHSNWATPWKLMSAHFVLHTNLERKIAEEQKQGLEEAYARLHDIFKVELKEKLPIYAIATDKDYQNFMAKFAGHHSSVWGGSLADHHPDKPGVIAFKDSEKFYIPIYFAHAVAHVYLDRVAKGYENLPVWFEEGIAEYVSRYHTPDLRKWSISNITNKGGLDPIEKFTTKMEITADDADQSQKSLKESGLLVCYILTGGNEALKKSFNDAVAVVPKGDRKKIEKALDPILAKSDALAKDLKAFLEANK